ncbi:hypothetical protein [uncultured Sneathiella sp.]|jgi:hypothetical protein|uniref:hypothetical protein n=1 Tax=uncultured Sneathiella sp. TaxID=879315 RepID=UPI0030EC8B19|tara:strand:- start:29575 stop:30477 length:903 start_codon:yes stop_codon:yes gene_type:complete
MFGRKAEKNGSVSFGDREPDLSAPTSSGKKSSDRLPDGLHKNRTGDINKSYIKVIRCLCFAQIATITLVLVLAAVIGSMSPLRRDVPWVVVVDRAGDVDVQQAVWRTGNSKELTVNEIRTTQFLRYYFQVTADYRQMGRIWQTSCVDDLIRGDNFADELCAYLPARMSEESHEAYVAANLDEVMKMVNARQTREVTLLREPLLMDTFIQDNENVYLWEYQIRLDDYDNRNYAGAENMGTGSRKENREADDPAYYSQKLVVRVWTTFNLAYRFEWAQKYQNPLNFRMLKMEVAKLSDGGGE